jgi:hypothetical protein
MPDTEASTGLPAQADEKPSAKYPTRELGRLIKYYREKVRQCTSAEQIGVIRNIQRLIDKGIGLEDIATALENYANDDYRKNQDPRYTYSIRTFFSEAKIQEWLKPRPKRAVQPPRPTLPEIAFTALERPKPVVPQTATESLEEDVEL